MEAVLSGNADQIFIELIDFFHWIIQSKRRFNVINSTRKIGEATPTLLKQFQL